MRAVLGGSGEASPLLGERPEPAAARGEVVLAVRAAALNRADLLQLKGLYPPPAGESDVPGLEAAGEIAALGDGVEGWRVGQRAAALLAGGGQAERVAVPAGQLLPVPASWSDVEAAALPEAAITSWVNLVREGELRAGETVLVAGATSGVGTYAVQLASALGARVLAAGRDLDRLGELRGLGVDATLRLGPDLPAEARAATGGRGVDLVMDLVGGDHLPEHLAALAPRGRLVLVGLMAGSRATLDLGPVLRRRLTLRGSVLRSRGRDEKAALVAEFLAFAGERLARRELLPRLDRVFPFADVAAAYAHLEKGRPFGKVVLAMP
ncbi:MAG: NAD(P)H-quinone oxidoreductase [Thermoanaerobaculia bacterium]|nr:NAD(P)H-quinone oxidoreductase [Thermoanaerobaculia bacterium]